MSLYLSKRSVFNVSLVQLSKQKQNIILTPRCRETGAVLFDSHPDDLMDLKLNINSFLPICN